MFIPSGRNGCTDRFGLFMFKIEDYSLTCTTCGKTGKYIDMKNHSHPRQNYPIIKGIKLLPLNTQSKEFKKAMKEEIEYYEQYFNK